jgi:hypothetical protein
MIKIYDSEGNYQELSPVELIEGLAAGDIIYYDGTKFCRLAIGTAGQVLTVNTGATAPEWQTP